VCLSIKEACKAKLWVTVVIFIVVITVMIGVKYISSQSSAKAVGQFYM